ncbi:MAG: hypothetical protein CMM47_10215 [Rhodospirillaceae bacterium]|nr:hypothetical protein [Rhodospirillaceae bacterium]
MPQRPKIAGIIRSIRANDGTKLEYEIVGSGPPLVMLHGLLANRFTFSRQREVLAEHYQLVLLNFRGSAGSNDPLPSDYGVGTSDLDNLRAVLDTEKLDRVSLFAHSSGGATAFLFATQSPERVDRAVLLEPTLTRLMPPTEHTRITAENEKIAAIAEAKGPGACLRAAVESMGGASWAKLDLDTQKDRLKGLAGSAPFVGPHLRSLNALAVTEDNVLTLRPRALLLYGANSFWFEKFIADRFRTLRPDLPVLTVEDASHNVHRDQADIVNAEVMAFLTN